jgi:hypothetical protein
LEIVYILVALVLLALAFAGGWFLAHRQASQHVNAAFWDVAAAAHAALETADPQMVQDLLQASYRAWPARLQAALAPGVWNALVAGLFGVAARLAASGASAEDRVEPGD